MWFKVLKRYGHHKEGDHIELKENSQFQILIDKKLIEESEAPIAETPELVAGTYSTQNIVDKVATKPKKEVKK